MNGTDLLQFKLLKDRAVLHRGIDDYVIYIPEQICGLPVTEIGNASFESCKNLRYLEVPPSLKIIGDGAFRNCENLRTVRMTGLLREQNLPNTDKAHWLMAEGYQYPVSYLPPVDYIGKEAFRNTALEVLNFSPAAAKVSIGASAFRESKLKEVRFPGCRTLRIGHSGFAGCADLEIFWASHAKITVEDDSFADCGKLTYLFGRVEYPNSP